MRRVLYVAPTGSGKTSLSSTVIALAVPRCVARRKRVLFFTHRRELMDQTVATLARAGVPDVLQLRAQYRIGNENAPVIVASVPTVSGDSWIAKLPDAGFIVVDEAHRALAPTYDGLLGRFPDVQILGLTATPMRSDLRAMGDVFEALVVGPSVRELTPEYLVPCRSWSPNEPLDSGRIAMPVLDAYRRFAAGRRAAVFCIDRKHAHAVAAELTAGGVPCEAALGDEDRTDTLERFRAGKLLAVTTVHALVEGWDDPGCSAAILARRFGHVGSFIQAGGRILRPAPWAGKTGAVLADLCGSILEHGPLDMDRTYSLDGRGISRADGDAIRQCKECGSVFDAARCGASCTVCETRFPVLARRRPRAVGVDLTEVTTPAQRSAVNLRINLRNVARARGYSAEWVERAYAAIARLR